MNREMLKARLASPVIRLALSGSNAKFEEFNEEDQQNVLAWIDFQLMPEIEEYMKGQNIEQ